MATTNYTETLDSQDFVAPYHYVPVMVHNDGSEYQLAPSLILKEAVLTGREVFDTDKKVIGWDVKRLPIVPESTFTVGLQIDGVNGPEYIKLKSGLPHSEAIAFGEMAADAAEIQGVKVLYVSARLDRVQYGENTSLAKEASHV